MKLEHIALNVKDPEAMASWWSDQFAMRIVLIREASNQMRFLSDSAGETLLEFYRNPAAPIPDYEALNCYSFHIAFATDTLEADRNRLMAAGAVPVGEVDVTDAGDLLAFLRDPWGVPFQLVQRKTLLL